MEPRSQTVGFHRARGSSVSELTPCLLRVRRPEANEISKWVYRQFSREVCPYNKKFAQELKEPAFAPREVIAGKDARTLAREIRSSRCRRRSSRPRSDDRR